MTPGSRTSREVADIVERGAASFSSGDLEAAAALWRRALELAPDDVRARAYLAWVENRIAGGSAPEPPTVAEEEILDLEPDVVEEAAQDDFEIVIDSQVGIEVDPALAPEPHVMSAAAITEQIDALAGSGAVVHEPAAVAAPDPPMAPGPELALEAETSFAEIVVEEEPAFEVRFRSPPVAPIGAAEEGAPGAPVAAERIAVPAVEAPEEAAREAHVDAEPEVEIQFEADLPQAPEPLAGDPPSVGSSPVAAVEAAVADPVADAASAVTAPLAIVPGPAFDPYGPPLLEQDEVTAALAGLELDAPDAAVAPSAPFAEGPSALETSIFELGEEPADLAPADPPIAVPEPHPPAEAARATVRTGVVPPPDPPPRQPRDAEAEWSAQPVTAIPDEGVDPLVQALRDEPSVEPEGIHSEPTRFSEDRDPAQEIHSEPTRFSEDRDPSEVVHAEPTRFSDDDLRDRAPGRSDTGEPLAARHHRAPSGRQRPIEIDAEPEGHAEAAPQVLYMDAEDPEEDSDGPAPISAPAPTPTPIGARPTPVYEEASKRWRIGPKDDPLAAARVAMERGDLEAAFVVAEKVVEKVAGVDAPELIKHLDLLTEIYERQLGRLDRIAAIGKAPGALHPRAAFLLSRIDGSLTFEDLRDVSGMPRIEVTRLLAILLRSRAIVPLD